MPEPMVIIARKPLILLTGATGYVGGRLLRALEQAGHRVRCLARRPESLKGRVAGTTEVVAGDVLDRGSLLAAMAGVRVAYYLVHSMDSPGAFDEKDRLAARHFGEVAEEAEVQRIIYLGGIGNQHGALSSHLRSRQEVGEILRSCEVQTIEFRASIIIGPGSLSFEMIRALVERLPIMVMPRWVSVPAQPIAIADVVEYLLEGLEIAVEDNPIFEIGGADRVSYAEIMRQYARQRGLRRLMLAVPVLTPRLSSLWLGLVTPLYARVGRRLIDSIRHPTVVSDESALRVFRVRPQGVREAIAMALRHEDHELAQTHWSDALSTVGSRRDWGGVRFGSRLVDSRVAHVDVAPASAFAPIRRIGGRTGWYYGNRLWRLRGCVDLLVGGVGLRRGRRDPEWLSVGDTLDWWRVEAFTPDRQLRLVAEMKLPGRAWLAFEVEGDVSGSTIRQTAIFEPVGLLGLMYWYALYPVHQLVFAGMLRGIAKAAEATSERSGRQGSHDT